MLSITIPDTLAVRLQTMAEETGAAVADLVLEVLGQYVYGMEEDHQDAEIARLALEEYDRDGGGKTLDEFARELGVSL